MENSPYAIIDRLRDTICIENLRTENKLLRSKLTNASLQGLTNAISDCYQGNGLSHNQQNVNVLNILKNFFNQ